MPANLVISYSNPALENKAKNLARELRIPLIANVKELPDCSEGYLMVDENFIALHWRTNSFKPIIVDFNQSKFSYRKVHGGGNKQLIARALGLHKKRHLTIYDVCAGLGSDAWVMASLGADVTLFERCKIIATLLEDGLQRYRQDLNCAHLSWRLLAGDAKQHLSQLSDNLRPQVIYLDPMYPDTGNTALPKKEMRILREIVGDDIDVTELFQLALSKATQRVVVKRPRQANTINQQQPHHQIIGKSTRYDIYLI